MPNSPTNHALGAWFVGLFGIMRLGWVEDNLLTPLAEVQQRVADQLTGAPSDMVYADPSCSGGDPMALGLGAMLAYPAAWGARLRVSASLRNLFSGPYRTHPAGAPSRLLFLVRMQYAFTDSEE